jgi:hypothetical protein
MISKKIKIFAMYVFTTPFAVMISAELFAIHQYFTTAAIIYAIRHFRQGVATSYLATQ